ncbi:hypothetical protein LCGC14_2162900 [marine sediment metagenome]|uniref:Uncharacterized protein n=1 Tax=marine sediment metagenome TaxID=412755 RepID=A0A0F9EEG6_9ZZZZ
MNIREYFKKQLDSAIPITEEIILKIIESRKEQLELWDHYQRGESDKDFNKKVIESVRQEYPIGDKSLFAIVYPQGGGNIEMKKLLESELDEFATKHTPLKQLDGIATPRFQKNAP